MKQSQTRILTTHAGSLPRPAALVESFARGSQGEAPDPAILTPQVEAAVRACLERQSAAGVDVANDGEQGRESFLTYVRERLSGYDGSWQRPIMRDIVAYPGFLAWRLGSMGGPQVSLLHTPVATGPVHYLGTAAVDRECRELTRLRGEVEKETGCEFVETFLTAASPGIVAAGMPSRVHDGYSEYVFTLADELREEYAAIVRAGHLLQLDCPDLAMERHTSFADRPLGEFLDFVETNVAAINRAIAGLDAAAVRLHVCWGNYEGPHDSDVPLEAIVERIYGAHVGGLVLSMANPRHAHELSVLRRHPLPRAMVLVTGVIDTTTNYVEHPELVADRIEHACAVVGDARRVLAGTDCGFDTAAGMRDVAEDVVWLKLAALRDGARIASERLFG